MRIIENASEDYKRKQSRARGTVNKAVRDGIIYKSPYCQKCKMVLVPLEAHHEDYTKPYQVEWLCKKCHGEKPKRKVHLEIDIGAWPNNHIVSRDVIFERNVPQ